MATISDISKKTGYSMMTVSRVVNNSKNVSEKARASIIKTIKDLNYAPNAAARRLVKQKSQTIGLIITYEQIFSSYYFLTIMKGVEEKLEKTNYNLIMYASNSPNVSSETKLLNLINQKFIDGFLVIAPSKDEFFMKTLSENKIPTIIIGASYPFFNCVDVDNNKATFLAVEYLLAKGHKSIGLIHGTRNRYDALEREKAFTECLEKHGIEINKKWFVDGRFEYRQAHLNTLKLIDEGTLPTAFFSANDLMAIGAMDAFRSRNIKIPEDISIMGFDDIDLSKLIQPPLTTVRQPLYNMGEEAASRIVELVEKENKQTVSRTIRMDTEIVERESVRKL
ncbi:MAG: LacI family DNA-binding transcriptional regulator [bacterium]|nr:LacI family DNA-binding transcriptional regulator [bacterium]